MPALRKIRCDNGVVLLRSPTLDALGVPHAFTTRQGGVSDAPFDTLNLAGRVSAGGADREAHRQENHRRVLAALGCPEHRWAGLHLVHGDQVVVHQDRDSVWGREPPQSDDASNGIPVGDAICTRAPGWMLKVTTADCAAVILASSDGCSVAVVHAGWGGVVGGVVARTIRTLDAAHGVPAAALRAAIGPCISLEAFEVGDEVATAFCEAGLGEHVHRRHGWARPHVDLHGAIAAQILQAGVPGKFVDGEPTCTVADPELFFSHRRDSGRTGRMAAVVATAGGR